MDKQLFISRLNYAMKMKKITQYSLSKRTGINKGSLSSYLSGKYLPKQDKIQIISKALNINPEWLMCNSNVIEYHNDNTNCSTNRYSYVENSVSAGIPDIIEANSYLEKIELPDIFLGRYAGRKDIIVMKVNGDSMNRVIPDGSFIILLTNISLNNLSDHDIVVFNYEYNYSMKRFINNKKDRKYIFRPDSFETCFEDIIFDYDNCDGLTIIGKVIMYNVLL
ncbi:LexA family transcriptional regulator [Peptostreptococcus canis]|uniref:Helix-turn-helix transcriptional regulator n=1 Tax=Peptostreptococcus canis TaxID=1159213 RepID=A0ABR6TK28_9FIRM|nr:XRE family transcriptional regulator [Peptostreptococcus canis]MBC2575764.1 helix-turn-helix transcriptional regulator [Peptostreptococcus canis]MBP1998121.1 transcriptional regulator with XRE-family HTH domain [Peptostreptococcus canis]